MTPLERFRSALEQAGSRQSSPGAWTCPAHDDKHASLSIKEGRDGRVILNCHAAAGCTFEDIVRAVNLDPQDLFPPKEQSNGTRATITATYPYTDENGNLLFEAVRLVPKDFRQRRRPRPDDPPDKIKDGWVWNLQGVRRVLYHLPKVIGAVERGLEVWIAEGEKDVHSLEQAGVTATCNPMGAGKWRDDYSSFLNSGHAVVVGDLDPAGRAHAETVARSLRAARCTVRVVYPAKGKDASDHLAAGQGLDQFIPAEGMQATFDDEPTTDQVPPGVEPRPFDHQIINLAQLARDGINPPDLICERLLYRGALHSLAGPPDSGKSTLLYYWAVILLAAGETVVLLDEESGREATTEKLLALGAEPDHLEHLVYVEYPGRKWDAADVRALELLLEAHRPVLVGFDSSAAFLAQALKDENAAVDVTDFYKRVLLEAARRHGTAVVILDHLGKDQVGGRYARGSGAKLATVDVGYMIDPLKLFNREQPGLLKLTVTKDRRGYLHRHHQVRVEVEDGTLAISFAKADDTTASDGAGLPPAAIKLLEVLRTAKEPLTIRMLIDRVADRYGNGLKRETASRALHTLADRGLADAADMGTFSEKYWTAVRAKETSESLV
jgi:hypothetical protein